MTSASLAASEALSARDAVFPRVSLADIENAIAFETCFTVGDAIDALDWNAEAPESLNLLTVAVLTMKNGFTVLGKSAPASPENFDARKGHTFAREDAIRQLWPLMGYALRDRLAD